MPRPPITSMSSSTGCRSRTSSPPSTSTPPARCRSTGPSTRTTSSMPSSRPAFVPAASMCRSAWARPRHSKTEKLTDYEIGWKATGFDGHLRTQIDGFYDVYNNFQVTVGYPAIPTFGFELNNPNTTHLYGFEAQAQAAFGPLSFDLGTTIMHSSLGKFFATDPRIAAFSPLQSVGGTHEPLLRRPDGALPDLCAQLHLQRRRAVPIHPDTAGHLTPRVNFGYVAPAVGHALRKQRAGGPSLRKRHPGRTSGLGTRPLHHLTVRHQPDEPTLCRRAEFRPALRRPPAPIWGAIPDQLLEATPAAARWMTPAAVPFTVRVFAGYATLFPDRRQVSRSRRQVASSRGSHFRHRAWESADHLRAIARASSPALGSACSITGLQLGDRIGTLAWNTEDHLTLAYAAMGVGLVAITQPAFEHRAPGGNREPGGRSLDRGRRRACSRCSTRYCLFARASRRC